MSTLALITVGFLRSGEEGNLGGAGCFGVEGDGDWVGDVVDVGLRLDFG